MMRVNVRFYAQCRDAVGGSEATIEAPAGATLAELTHILQARYPGLGKLWKTLVIAVNEEIARGDERLSEGDTMALLPPVSGG